MGDYEQERRHKRRRKKVIRILAIVLILAIIAGVIYYYKVYKPAAEAPTYIYKEAFVQHGDLSQTIEESGTVSLETASVDYDLTISPNEDDDDDDDDEDDSSYLIIEDVYVVQGQRISEGDALFKLKESSVRSVRRLLESAESDAAVTLAEAQSSLTLDTQTAANTMRSAQTAASTAQETYDITIAEIQNQINSYSAENEVLAKDIQTCQENLTNSDFNEAYADAKEAYEDALEEYEQTDEHNVTAYIDHKSTYLSAKSALESYENQIETWNDTITSDMERVASNEAKLADLQEALANKQTVAAGVKKTAEVTGSTAASTYNNTVNTLSETVTEAQNSYDEAANELAAFEEFVGDDGIIYANGNGLVVSVAYEEGDELENTGAMVTYAQDDSYTVSVDISEEDIPAFSVGDTCDIVFTAYPDETYTGTVTVIGTSASSNYSATISYPVTIKIGGDTSKIYGGMTADVTFVTETRADIDYISAKAVVEQDGKSYVYVKGDGGAYSLQEVTTGFTDGSSVEIVSGLSEGDIAYIVSEVTTSEEELQDTSTEESTEASTEQNMTGNGSNGMPDMGGGMPDMGGMPGMP